MGLRESVCKGSYETLRGHMENVKYRKVLSIVKVTFTYMLHGG